MASAGSKQSRASVAPPRTLNVQKFAESRSSELEALHAIVANRLNNDFRSQRNKRRRTTGYDNRNAKYRHLKKRKAGAIVDVNKSDISEKDKENAPRHVRRRIELKKNPESGFCTSGDGTKRLRTHVWHAKRFTMIKNWGFHLPLGLQGRGRGSRTLLKWLKEGVIVHDASYFSAVQLEGPEVVLVSTLNLVLRPSPTLDSEVTSGNILSGIIYGNAMLRHVGASFSHIIAPVTYMWRPLESYSTSTDGHGIDGCDESQRVDQCASSRQVWVWIHAAAFREGYDALKSACQLQMEETGHSINCVSLEGQLGKLEVMGSKAFHLLQKVLNPVMCASGNSRQFKSCSFAKESGHENSSFLDREDQVCPPAILCLTVNDPRALSDKVSEVKPKATSANTGAQVVENEAFSMNKRSKIELLSPLGSQPEETSVLSSEMHLWDASKGIFPPVGESVLCREKHQERMALFGLGNRSLARQNASIEGQCSRLCPIMLLKNNDKKSSIERWSIILPLSWVRAFWVPLVSNGAHAIGLREKHWIACDVGLPYFPLDFPDCNAYSCVMETKKAAFDKNSELRPPSMRPVRVPILPPWNTVLCAFHKKSVESVDAQTRPKDMCAEDMANSISFTQSDSGNNDLVTCSDVPFDGFVARTSNVLKEFIGKFGCDHLPLLPFIRDSKKHISTFMEDEKVFDREPSLPVPFINYSKQPCFVRVLLQAFKEGVFEEAAVICAPHVADIKLWTSRLGENDRDFQMPKSSVDSYFVQQSSGKWELHIPDDLPTMESHRWPIGFVTTECARGSKKPYAIALCEAVLLARLRKEQWKEVAMKRRKKEIYVLVRNMRSTAYRLALATVVLEQQEEDLEFM